MSTEDSTELDEFIKLSRRDTRKPCNLNEGLKKLSKKDRTLVENAIAEVDIISAGAIEKWFKQRDIRVPNAAVIRHRKQECKCFC